MLVPEEGRRLLLQVRDKGFPKARALRPLRPPSRQPRPSRCCSQSQHTAPSLPVAPGADGGSPGCWRASHSRGHPHAAPFPQCNSPRSRGPTGHWRTPKCGPSKQTALFSSAPALLAALLPSPVCSRRRCSQVLGSLPGPRRAWSRCPGCAQPRSRCHRQCARHTRAPQPLPQPFSDAQPPPAAVAASSASG